MLLTRKKNLIFSPTLCEISGHLLPCRPKERNICSVLDLLPSSHAGRLQELENRKTRETLLWNGSRHRVSCKHNVDYDESTKCDLKIDIVYSPLARAAVNCRVEFLLKVSDVAICPLFPAGLSSYTWLGRQNHDPNVEKRILVVV